MLSSTLLGKVTFLHSEYRKFTFFSNQNNQDAHIKLVCPVSVGICGGSLGFWMELL